MYVCKEKKEIYSYNAIKISSKLYFRDFSKNMKNNEGVNVTLFPSPKPQCLRAFAEI